MKCWWMSSTRSSCSPLCAEQGFEDGRRHFREPGTFGKRDHRERKTVGGRQHLGGKPIRRSRRTATAATRCRGQACDEPFAVFARTEQRHRCRHDEVVGGDAMEVFGRGREVGSGYAPRQPTAPCGDDCAAKCD